MEYIIGVGVAVGVVLGIWVIHALRRTNYTNKVLAGVLQAPDKTVGPDTWLTFVGAVCEYQHNRRNGVTYEQELQNIHRNFGANCAGASCVTIFYTHALNVAYSFVPYMDEHAVESLLLSVYR